MEMTNRKEKLEWRTYRKEFQFRCQIGEEHYFRCQIENFLKKIRQGSNLQALEFMINKQHFFISERGITSHTNSWRLLEWSTDRTSSQLSHFSNRLSKHFSNVHIQIGQPEDGCFRTECIRSSSGLLDHENTWMQYTSEGNETFGTYICNICVKHMQYAD
jgi:hypothetical protein